MKFRFDLETKVFEYEREPMSKERFNVLCKLAGFSIGGAVLLAAIHMAGIWALVWGMGALAAVGLYKLIKSF